MIREGNLESLVKAKSKGGNGGPSLRNALRWLASLRPLWGTRAHRQLRLCESLALGERRFLSVVEFGEQRFLVGGAGNWLSVLAVLQGTSGRESSQYGEKVPVWTFANGEFKRQANCG